MPFENAFHESESTMAWLYSVVKHEGNASQGRNNTQLLRQIASIIRGAADEIEKVIKDYDASTVEAFEQLNDAINFEGKSEMPQDRINLILADLCNCMEKTTFPPRDKGMKEVHNG